MRHIYLLIFYLLIITTKGYGQKLVQYPSSDKLVITADYYETEKESNKYMLLFHQADYSRGEHKESAQRLIKLGYNCLAVDLRMGNEVNYVRNETAYEAKKKGFKTTYYDSEKDITASIEYIKSIDSDAEIFLFGSSYSASLCLKIANERKDINAVIAFSPGEYFENITLIKDDISGLNIPMFVACQQTEFNYVQTLTSRVDQSKLTLFKPERGDGLHGSKTLWWESSTRNEYWLALLFFLKDF
ncbi:MAG: dienelactone hydrolase family protein [Bacteroidales bacterium]|nr:dienelactone hydrolase family protein [Bacteroidales bacterium]